MSNRKGEKGGKPSSRSTSSASSKGSKSAQDPGAASAGSKLLKRKAPEVNTACLLCQLAAVRGCCGVWCCRTGY